MIVGGLIVGFGKVCGAVPAAFPLRVDIAAQTLFDVLQLLEHEVTVENLRDH
ncbi:hypothetical protein [Bradyrhizobium sp. LTSPM299]|uniref:hypothetical protein n=1 Tax=Bradyrhizobium sp. LTSPM299 TaxID=1619233 RepID=UPI000AA69729|nr:hypothetical protein [Bradyrhizobium sp. LTSPM299]